MIDNLEVPSWVNEGETIVALKSDYRDRLKTFGRYMIGAGVATLLFVAGWKFAEEIDKHAGPEGGITFVATKGCNEVDTIKPYNIGNIKVSITSLKSLGAVSVELTTQEVPEHKVRSSGMFEDPTVHVNTLEIICEDELTQPQQAELVKMLSVG